MAEYCPKCIKKVGYLTGREKASEEIREYYITRGFDAPENICVACTSRYLEKDKTMEQEPREAQHSIGKSQEKNDFQELVSSIMENEISSGVKNIGYILLVLSGLSLLVAGFSLNSFIFLILAGSLFTPGLLLASIGSTLEKITRQNAMHMIELKKLQRSIDEQKQ